VKPKLPKSTPTLKGLNAFLTQHYAEREAQREDYFDPRNPDEPVQSPYAFAETVDEFLLSVEKQLAVIDKLRVSGLLHPIVKRMLAIDLEQTKRNNNEWSMLYGISNKKMTDSLNALLWSFEKLGFPIHTSGRIHLRLSVCIFGVYKNFTVRLLNQYLSGSPLHIGGKSRIKFIWHEGARPSIHKIKLSWDFDTINAQAVRDIIMDLVRQQENFSRSDLTNKYTERLRIRQNLPNELESNRQEQIEKQAAQVKQLEDYRSQLLSEALKKILEAQRIRGLIAAFEQTLQLNDKADDTLLTWLEWANKRADEIDPRLMNPMAIKEWVHKFKLK